MVAMVVASSGGGSGDSFHPWVFATTTPFKTLLE
jgi:hypothetical protein